MLILRYFAVVGTGLLALLFLTDAFLPPPPSHEVASVPIDKSTIRIKSQALLPAPVVIGGSTLNDGS
jgi:hypothetical protein